MKSVIDFVYLDTSKLNEMLEKPPFPLGESTFDPPTLGIVSSIAASAGAVIFWISALSNQPKFIAFSVALGAVAGMFWHLAQKEREAANGSK